MAKDLMIKKNTIILPEDNSYYMAEDIIEIIEELLVCIATELKAKFSCENYNGGTYSDSGIEAVFDNGILRIEERFHSLLDDDNEEDEEMVCREMPVIDVKEIKIY